MAGSDGEGMARNLVFYLNGQRVVLENPDPSLLLVDYLRSDAVGLTGTKLSCGEGGCGGCTVMIAHWDRAQGRPVRRAVNACLRPICSLDGTAVTTVEGIGSVRTRLNPVQQRLADYNGTQCGYCSPGFVMNAYAYLREHEQPTEAELESLFGGNICRCTGFRPILDAMRSFARPPFAEGVAADSFPAELKDWRPRPLHFAGRGYEWFRPVTLAMARRLKEEHYQSANDAKLVAGNTSVGIYKKDEDNPAVLVDISAIDELHRTEVLPGGAGIEVGGAVTYSRLIEFLASLRSSTHPEDPGLQALERMAEQIAGVQVRNAATVGGAISLLWQHAAGWGQPFPSDLYTVLAALGATVTLSSRRYAGERRQFSALKLPAAAAWPHDAVVLSVRIPLTPASDHVQAYRVARREQNAHALVNACFRVSLDAEQRVTAAAVVYGAIAGLPVQAARAEAYLKGRPWNEAALAGALDRISAELQGQILPLQDGISPEYRLRLAQAFWYRFFLQVAMQVDPGSVDPVLASGAANLERPLSGGSLDYPTNPAKYPVSQPLPKLTATIQVSGEQVYTTDIANPPGTLFSAFVWSPKAHAAFRYPSGVSSVLARLQGRFPGVHGYFTATDMPGSYNGFAGDDPVLAEGEVTCYGQAVGVVVAEDERVALDAAAWVQQECIAWSELPAVLGIDAALAPGGTGTFADPSGWAPIVRDGSDRKWLAQPEMVPEWADGVVSGRQRSGLQAHFYMELQSALAIPEEGTAMTVYSSTQSADAVQSAVAAILNIPKHRVRVRTRPLGGSFGGKTTRSPFMAGPVALAAWLLNRPVRLAINRNVDTSMIGKRHAFAGEYHVAYKNDGTIQGMTTNLYSDGGNTVDCSFAVMHVAKLDADNCYDIPNFRVQGHVCKTNEASNNAMRAFGVIQTLLIQEDAIEQVAYRTQRRPEEIRERQLYANGNTTAYGERLKDCIIRSNWEKLKASSEFSRRLAAIAEFNRLNRWKKRGISMMPLKYGAQYEVPNLNQGSALVSAFAPDGSVLVQGGGVENGQGLHTKMAQIAAQALRIPLGMVRVGEVDTFIIPNAISTGADSGSDLNGWAVYIAATQLRKRLEDYCEIKGIKGYTEHWAELWPAIVSQAHWDRIDLAAHAFYKTEGITADHPYAYYSWSAGCSEVELDVLTGQCSIVRSDILFDAGLPLNPLVDAGQVQGAFVQGIGYVLTEEVLFSPDGRLITDGTWEYKPPCTKTIPVDFRVSLNVSKRTVAQIPIKETVVLMARSAAAAAAPEVGLLARQLMADLHPAAGRAKVPQALVMGHHARAAYAEGRQILEQMQASGVSVAEPLAEGELEFAGAAALHSSKCIGEPPLILAATVFFALKHAVLAARADAGVTGWFELEAPATVARVLEACLVNRDQLKL